MRKKILVSIIITILSSGSMAGNLKLSAPNQYDCTIDELDMYIMKRTENLRKDTTLSTWEDFKTTKAKAQLNGSSNSDIGNDGSGSGNTESEYIDQLKNKDNDNLEDDDDDCNLFFSDIGNIDMADFGISFDNLDAILSGGLANLKDIATAQIADLGDELGVVLGEGFCKRLKEDIMDEIDDRLDEKIGYTTGDIMDGNFINEVINDQLSDRFDSSDAELLNLLDPSLNDNRRRYLEKQVDNKLDSIKDDILE